MSQHNFDRPIRIDPDRLRTPGKLYRGIPQTALEQRIAQSMKGGSEPSYWGWEDKSGQRYTFTGDKLIAFSYALRRSAYLGKDILTTVHPCVLEIDVTPYLDRLLLDGEFLEDGSIQAEGIIISGPIAIKDIKVVEAVHTRGGHLLTGNISLDDLGRIEVPKDFEETKSREDILDHVERYGEKILTPLVVGYVQREITEEERLKIRKLRETLTKLLRTPEEARR
jgi:hypothetical protein